MVITISARTFECNFRYIEQYIVNKLKGGAIREIFLETLQGIKLW